MRFTYVGVYSCARQSVGASPTTAAAIGVVGGIRSGITEDVAAGITDVVVLAKHVTGGTNGSAAADPLIALPAPLPSLVAVIEATLGGST
jgi:hypothetical protein